MYGWEVSLRRDVLQRKPFSFHFCALYELILDGRVFLAEARMILSKMVWNFDLEMADPSDGNWMDQKAYLVFEPKALMVKLKAKALV